MYSYITRVDLRLEMMGGDDKLFCSEENKYHRKEGAEKLESVVDLYITSEATP